MASAVRWIKNHLPSRRRLIQLYAALLYNAHLKGFITGEIYAGGGKALCVPGLNCYSCPGAAGACPLGALQNALASSGSRAPTYVLGILLLFGITFGRTICGWLCPFGLLQELLHKIPTVKIRKNRVTRALGGLKYVLLAVFVVLIPLWYAGQSYPVPAFCKYICPAGTLEGAVGLLANPANGGLFDLLGLLFARKFVVMIAILLACVFVYRAFCRFLCPLGAIYGLFARVAVIGVKAAPTGCTGCGRCTACCPMDVRRVGDHECIHCGRCVGECPAGVIAFRAGNVTLSGPAAKKKRRGPTAVAWIAALAVLAGALWAVNRPGAEEVPAVQADAEVGWEAGMRAPDFTVELYGGGTLSLSDCLGKPTVLNFWATWCTPCCAELPYFDALYRAHADEAVVAAIHADLVTDDVEAYLAGFDYAMPFGLDGTGEALAAFGGSSMLPQTVVIGADGIIVYNAVGSVDGEALEALLAEATSD